MPIPEEADAGFSRADLIEHIMARAATPAAARDQLAQLVSATQAIASELELAVALRTVVEVAKDLVSASFGAVGVISPDGHLEEFIHIGIESHEVSRIGSLPTGHGILGAVITQSAAIRLDDITRDPRAIGFPDNHPPMTSFLGVPVRVGGAVYGNLYLTGSSRGTFDDTDEQIISMLASMAGTAIANARLYEDAHLGQRWIAASEEINQSLLSGALAESDVTLVAQHVMELADADLICLVLPQGGQATPHFAFQLGSLAEAHDPETDAALADLASAAVQAIGAGAGRAERVQVVESSAGGTNAVFGALMILPWNDSRAGGDGALVVARRRAGHPFTTADRTMANRFARSVAIARELSHSRLDRERIALTDERDRIARDLHDHVIQSLFAIGLGLQSLVSSVSGPVSGRLAGHVDAIDVTIRQIRQTIFRLNTPAHAASFSQKASLNQLVRETLEGKGIDSSLDFSGPIDTLLDDELGEEVSAVLREALSNVVRHAEASRVDVSVAVSANEVRIVVTDNGLGLGEIAHRSGLENLLQRAAMRGGTFTTAARAPSGTTLDWSVPVGAAQ